MPKTWPAAPNHPGYTHGRAFSSSSSLFFSFLRFVNSFFSSVQNVHLMRCTVGCIARHVMCCACSAVVVGKAVHGARCDPALLVAMAVISSYFLLSWPFALPQFTFFPIGNRWLTFQSSAVQPSSSIPPSFFIPPANNLFCLLPLSPLPPNSISDLAGPANQPLSLFSPHNLVHTDQPHTAYRT